MFRSDNSYKGGGLLAYVLSDIPCRTLNNYKLVYTESIILEVLLRDKKWIVVYSYKNPPVTNANFTEDFTNLLDRLLMDYSNVIVMGDPNFNMGSENSKTPLHDICDIYSLTNLICEPYLLLPKGKLNYRCSPYKPETQDQKLWYCKHPSQ